MFAGSECCIFEFMPSIRKSKSLRLKLGPGERSPTERRKNIDNSVNCSID